MTNEELFERAVELMPGGVSSPVRAFKAVGGIPRFIVSAHGSQITDASGKTFIDMVSSWGPLILGHAHPRVVTAIEQAARRGTSYGAPTPGEIELAEIISRAIPSIEMLRFVSSGTEATMSALRLARAATGRSKILKFAGGYHGHVDALLSHAGSGVATFGIPGSPGVTMSTASETVIVPYNSKEGIAQAFNEHGDEIAAVIVEPVAGNMGVIPPADGFLEGLRDACTRAGSLLVFDEVITGFRVGLSGAQGVYGIAPDLTTLGKIIGGGLPIGAYGGRRDLMEQIAPSGPVYQAGTLSGNPISVAAGTATLSVLFEEDPYSELDAKSAQVSDGLTEASKSAAVPLVVQRVGSMFTAFFTDREVIDFDTAKTSDTQLFARFFHALLDEGVYWPPSQFEAAFVGTSHTEHDIQRLIDSMKRAFERISE